MKNRLRIDRSHTEIVPKSTIRRVLKFLKDTDLEPPYLVMDKARILSRARSIGRKIRNSKVYYAVKANPEIEVLKLINKLGAGFEIASEGELALLLSIGVEPSRIITSNPIKSFRFLRMAAECGLSYFAFDSKDEVRKMRDHVPGSNVYVRLTVPNEGSEWPLSKKFGVELEEAEELLLYAKKKGLNPIGITFHVGSQCNNVYNWNSALDKAKILWDRMEQAGISLSVLDIGGGYPIRYTKHVVDIQAIDRNISSLIAEKFPRKTRIFIEPGRAVVGDAGIFVSRVAGKAKRGDENWLYIEVGVFNGLMETIGGIKYRYIVEGAKHTKKWTLAGPSCDSFDVIDREVVLPEPDIGGLVLILSSGAYTISYASEFNGFAIPKTILI
ncbi:MAG: type III PLP-dependent enzyme [Nitrospirae bacterium]|nr:MAG: type III PLP-dependent enzyme [Nitrospirota bacterium]